MRFPKVTNRRTILTRGHRMELHTQRAASKAKTSVDNDEKKTQNIDPENLMFDKKLK